MRRILLGTLALLVSGLVFSRATLPASACCLPAAPTTYECSEDRGLYLRAMDLAAYNMLFPGDSYFGLPRLETGLRGNRSSVEPVIPPILLRSIGWIESVITQASRVTPYGGVGPALISFDCGHGIMQVTSGMTTGLGEYGHASKEQALVATHFGYNIARGAVILADKWNAAPENRPIAGTDTNGDPSWVENWYFAVWSYNGFTGPGANRSNHPLDPVYGGWPRTAYSCGSANDGFGHNRSSYPYQELVWGCAAHPPVVKGKALWAPFELAYPDLNDPRFRGPLDLRNFAYPYANMDIPTPFGSHRDPTEKPRRGDRDEVMGTPDMSVSASTVRIIVNRGQTVGPQQITVANRGSGVLSWMAVTSAPWLQVSPPAGVAIGPEVMCVDDPPCKREGTLTLTVDASRLPEGTQTGSVRIIAPGTKQEEEITVTIASMVKVGVPGIAKN